MVHTLRFFFSSKCSLFHNSNVFGSCIIHILYTGVLKLKKIIPAPKGQIKKYIYRCLKCIVLVKLLKPGHSIWITLYNKAYFVGPMCCSVLGVELGCRLSWFAPGVASRCVAGILRFLRSDVGCCETDAITSGSALPSAEPRTLSRVTEADSCQSPFVPPCVSHWIDSGAVITAEGQEFASIRN